MPAEGADEDEEGDDEGDDEESEEVPEDVDELLPDDDAPEEYPVLVQ